MKKIEWKRVNIMKGYSDTPIWETKTINCTKSLNERYPEIKVERFVIRKQSNGKYEIMEYSTTSEKYYTYGQHFDYLTIKEAREWLEDEAEYWGEKF